MVVFAHTGHWLIEVPIYLGVPIAALIWFKLADKRAARREEEEAGSTD